MKYLIPFFLLLTAPASRAKPVRNPCGKEAKEVRLITLRMELASARLYQCLEGVFEKNPNYRGQY